MSVPISQFMRFLISGKFLGDVIVTGPGTQFK